MDILQVIQKKIKESFNVEVTGTSTFKETNIDSLDLVELIFDLESELDISFDDDEFEGLKTVNDVVALIEKKRA